MDIRVKDGCRREVKDFSLLGNQFVLHTKRIDSGDDTAVSSTGQIIQIAFTYANLCIINNITQELFIYSFSG